MKVADHGFGDSLNAYAHTMSWFRDELYVGTTRANLCLIKAGNPPDLPIWPTKCPADVYDLDLRAQIWRYSPNTRKWRKAYISPLVEGKNGRPVPRELGYRGMTVFRGPADPQPALYLSSWASARSGRSSLLVRSRDGESFQPLPPPTEDERTNSCRTLLRCNRWLYTSPTGSKGGAPNEAASAVVLATPDPAKGQWRAVSEVGFGDPDNASVFEMAVFNGGVYVGTLNPASGFQIWKADIGDGPPRRWKKIITKGAYRGPLNEIAISMCAFNGALYVGSGIQHGGYDRTHKIGPAASEVIRIHPDDSWELIVGDRRDTPSGHKVPLSGLGPGFNNFFNSYVWRMSVHDGYLYAGTYNWTVWLPYLNLERWPSRLREQVLSTGIDQLVSETGGFDLWRTPDGVNWAPVTRDGFGNPYNYGVRTMVSSPHGLWLGTANPFGPDVATKTQDGWTYLPNEQGGLEIWLGTAPQDSSEEQSKNSAHAADGNSDSHRIILNCNRFYDERMYDELVNKYYDYSDFHNFGLWLEDTRNQKEASENLEAALLEFIPRKRGTILDVACGKGATTRYLFNYFRPENITGINISDKQVETCRRKGTGAKFLPMDATQLEFPDESFNHIICVEAVFHFNTREKFLREALRVLKPGGSLVLSDVLFKSHKMEQHSPFRTEKNFIEGVEAYEQLYREVGFRDVQIVDATHECATEFFRHCHEYLVNAATRRNFDQRAIGTFLRGIQVPLKSIQCYLLVGVRKPNRRK